MASRGRISPSRVSKATGFKSPNLETRRHGDYKALPMRPKAEEVGFSRCTRRGVPDKVMPISFQPRDAVTQLAPPSQK